MLLLLIAISLNALVSTNGQMKCRDESGKIVDWYVVYKFPHIANANSPLDTGLRYAYITSDSTTSWTLSNISVADGDKSIFGQTLHSVYNSKSDPKLTFIGYNDEPPNGETVSAPIAHAKGAVAADDTTGFWLIHSVPHFVSSETSHKYEYPSTGARYGQTALCISVKISEFGNIIDQLLNMEPKIYSIKVSNALKAKVAKVTDLINNKWTTGHVSNTDTITSASGVAFTSFSKNFEFGADLYSDLVAKALKIPLYVETWRKNPGTPLPSNCKLSYNVENVHQLSFKFANSANTATFNYTDDHSKWALSQQSTHPYVCIGDINRMQSQFKRGGGTTCFQSSLVWNSFKQSISDTEKC